METEKIISEINKLDLADKIILVEDIWDSIARNNNELPLPEWQKNGLEKRYSEYKAGKLDLHDWNAVHEDLRKKYK